MSPGLPAPTPQVPRRSGTGQPVSGFARALGNASSRLALAAWLALSLGAPPAVALDLPAIASGARPSSEARSLAEVRVEWQDDAWREEVPLRIKPGDPLDMETVRVELERLVATGRFAAVSAETEDGPAGPSLIFLLQARRVVSDVRFPGNPPLGGEALVALTLSRGDELTAATLSKATERVRAFYAKSGFPHAAIRVTTNATDDPLAMIVNVQVSSGEPLLIVTRRVLVAPQRPEPAVQEVLATLPDLSGERADDELLVADAAQLVTRLRALFYFDATVSSRYLPGGVAETRVNLGPRFSLRVSGNQLIDRSEIEEALDLPKRQQVAPEVLRPSLEAFYRRRGFYDAELDIERVTSRDGRSVAIVVVVREGLPLLISKKEFPCAGEDLPFDLNAEVDGVLQEEFQSAGLVRDPPSRVVDSALSGDVRPGRGGPLWLRPYDSYSKESYSSVRKHLSELLEAEGYFSAEVRDEQIVRAR